MPPYPSFQGAIENLGTSRVTSLAGHGTWGHDEPSSPCGHLCTSPAELLGLRHSCCGGHLAAHSPLLVLLSLWMCKSSITHVPLGCFCWSGVFSSVWMVVLRSHWPVRPRGSLPALALGYGSGAVGSGSHAVCHEAAAELILPLCFESCHLQSQHQRAEVEGVIL